MPSEYFLDTNIAIYFLQNFPKVRTQVERHSLRLLPYITAAELLYGAKRSGRREENLRVCLDFLSLFTIVYPNRKTLDAYSDLCGHLKQLGRPLPVNDVWQAALALQHDAVLVTNDQHFSAVPGLRTENWAS